MAMLNLMIQCYVHANDVAPALTFSANAMAILTIDDDSFSFLRRLFHPKKKTCVAIVVVYCVYCMYLVEYYCRAATSSHPSGEFLPVCCEEDHCCVG